MILVENKSKNPAYNHALEEYLLSTGEDVFILWQNEPTVLVGRNQNVYKEVDIEYCNDKGIHIVRRLSGGGTIYTDLENMQYTFITREQEGDSFKYFAAPIINALKKLNINAEFTGRNDMVIDGRKFSGNAQYHQGNRVLHHGTILFSVDMYNLQNCLTPNKKKFEGKNVSSVKSRVGFLKEYTDKTIQEFMDVLEEEICKEYGIIERYDPKDIEEQVLKIQKERFESKEWNFGQNPKFSVDIIEKHPFGLVEYGINVSKGRIKEIKINGDFFGRKNISGLEDLLRGQLFEIKEITNVLSQIDINDYIEGAQKEDIINDLFQEGEV